MDSRFRLTLLLLALGITLAACQSKSAAPPSSGVTIGLEARLRPVNSAVGGAANVVDRGDGVALMVTINGLAPGMYRLALHQKTNCNSPNATSAGPAWAPPGVTPGTFLPSFQVNDNNNQVVTVRLSGVRADGPEGLLGRTLVVHFGETVDQAFPGQKNGRMACGVFEYATTLF